MDKPSDTSSVSIRIIAFLNGDDQTTGTPLQINTENKTLQQLLDTASEVLLAGIDDPEITLKRVFTAEGAEVASINDILPDDSLYFSAGEDFIPPSPVTGADESTADTTANDDNTNDQAGQNGLITQALTNTSYFIASTYNLFSHAVHTHAPTSVSDMLTTTEQTVASYTRPLIQTSSPYIGTTLQWSDQMLQSAIEQTKIKTNAFLESESGQRLQQTVSVPIQQVSEAAVQSYQSVMALPETQSAQGFLTNLKDNLGSLWNDRMQPMAMHLYEQLNQTHGPQSEAAAADAAATSGQQSTNQGEEPASSTTTTTTN